MKIYIEMGEKKAGSQAELAKFLGLKPNYISMAKNGQRGIPDATCIKLADFIGADRLEVIAASNLVTEKDEERRRLFESCFKKTTSAAASLFVAAIVTTILSLSPTKPLQAASFEQSKGGKNVYYVKLFSKDRRKRFRRKSDFLSDLIYRLLSFFEPKHLPS